MTPLHTIRAQLLMILIIFVLGHHLSAQAQEGQMILTKQFTSTLEKHELIWYTPVERWLKLTPMTSDQYLQYDVVVHSPPNVEARIIIKEDGPKLYPNIEIVKMLAHISTNEEDTLIEVTEYPRRRSEDMYGADFVLYADFIPKSSFSNYPNGRLLCLYKEGQALVQYILLYEGALETYFKMPIRFIKKSDLVD
jgi:hypothetical protein